MNAPRTVSILALLVSLSPRVSGDAVAVWHFDEAPGATVAIDSAGSHNGTLNGTAAFSAGGIVGNAIHVARAGNGYVSMGNNFGFTGIDFSIVAWVKSNPNDTAVDSLFVAKHHSTVFAGYILAMNT